MWFSTIIYCRIMTIFTYSYGSTGTTQWLGFSMGRPEDASLLGNMQSGQTQMAVHGPMKQPPVSSHHWLCFNASVETWVGVVSEFYVFGTTNLNVGVPFCRWIWSGIIGMNRRLKREACTFINQICMFMYLYSLTLGHDHGSEPNWSLYC